MTDHASAADRLGRFERRRVGAYRDLVMAAIFITGVALIVFVVTWKDAQDRIVTCGEQAALVSHHITMHKGCC